MSFIVTPPVAAAPTPPGGADTQIQFNNAGAFDGNSNMVYDAVNSAFSPTKIIGLDAVNFNINSLGTVNANGANLVVQPLPVTGFGFAGNLNLLGSAGTYGGNVYLAGGSSSSAGVEGGSVTIKPGASGVGSVVFGFVEIRNGNNGVLFKGSQNSSGLSALGFFGVTPSIRATTGSASAAFVANVGTAVQDVSTFDGYTIAQIVKALRNFGFLT